MLAQDHLNAQLDSGLLDGLEDLAGDGKRGGAAQPDADAAPASGDTVAARRVAAIATAPDYIAMAHQAQAASAALTVSAAWLWGGGVGEGCACHLRGPRRPKPATAQPFALPHRISLPNNPPTHPHTHSHMSTHD